MALFFLRGLAPWSPKIRRLPVQVSLTQRRSGIWRNLEVLLQISISGWCKARPGGKSLRWEVFPFGFH